MKFKHSLLVALFAVSLSACEKDENNNGGVDQKDAKAALRTSSQEMKEDIVEMFSSDGATALTDLSGIISDFDGVFTEARVSQDGKKFTRILNERTREFKAVFIPKKALKAGKLSEDSGFDFNEFKGIYEWDATEEDFIQTGNSNIIEIKFPTEGSPTNDALLKITEYAEQKFQVEDEFGVEDAYYPTKLKADLSIGNVKYVELNYTASYLNNDGFVLPLSANVSLFLNPFTYTINFKEDNSKTLALGFSIKKSSDVILENGYKLHFADADKSILNKLEGYSQYRQLKIQGEILVDKLDEATSYNNIAKLALYDGKNKLGDIVFESSNDEEVAYIKYADGSKEKLEDIFKPALDELEAYFNELASV